MKLSNIKMISFVATFDFSARLLLLSLVSYIIATTSTNHSRNVVPAPNSPLCYTPYGFSARHMPSDDATLMPLDDRETLAYQPIMEGCILWRMPKFLMITRVQSRTSDACETTFGVV